MLLVFHEQDRFAHLTRGWFDPGHGLWMRGFPVVSRQIYFYRRAVARLRVDLDVADTLENTGFSVLEAEDAQTALCPQSRRRGHSTPDHSYKLLGPPPRLRSIRC
jgi:hypothetical protein